MAVTGEHVRSGLQDLGLSGRPICVHSSLASFGRLEGGAPAFVDAVLAEGCTLLVPTFTTWYQTDPPPGRRIARNGWTEGSTATDRWMGNAYDPSISDCGEEMGAISRVVALTTGRVRGDHPLDSFAALGPLAVELVAGQTPLDVYRPLEELIAREGSVLTIGVGLDRVTLLHLAESRAGRELFRRWAIARQGDPPIECVVGGCSSGFEKLRPAVQHIARATTVGESRWEAFSARDLVELAAEAIKRDPAITGCGKSECVRCPDAIAGGPILRP